MIKLVSQEFSQNEWLDIILEFKNLSLMQTWEYAEAKAALSSWRIERAIFLDGDTVVGAVQAMVRTIPVIGHGLVWINQGPLWRKSGNEDFSLLLEMLKEIRRYWVEEKHFYIRIAPNVYEKAQSLNELGELGYHPTDGSLGWSSEILDLSKTAEQLRKDFKNKWRGDLNASERRGATCVAGISKELLEEFLSHYQPFLEKKNLSTPVTPEFLRQLHSLLPDDRKAWMFEGRFEQESLGGLLIAGYGDSCIALSGSNPNAKGRELRSGNLVWWNAILKMKELGYRWFDVGGADPRRTPKGILHFKKGLNGEPYQLVGEFECSRGKLLDRAISWYIQRTRE
jgi:lipid II:glycine glycyltransferase (peptidoglycan interpeptide bridge formation enzyme)